MVFQNNDDLVYPNLVNCQIASNALVFATNDALPPPPPPISTSTAESLLNKSPAVKYDFIVEKKILAREKERGDRNFKTRGLQSSEMEQGSVEVTLSDLKDTIE
jgi:hypothetical protein